MILPDEEHRFGRGHDGQKDNRARFRDAFDVNAFGHGDGAGVIVMRLGNLDPLSVAGEHTVAIFGKDAMPHRDASAAAAAAQIATAFSAVGAENRRGGAGELAALQPDRTAGAAAGVPAPARSAIGQQAACEIHIAGGADADFASAPSARAVIRHVEYPAARAAAAREDGGVAAVVGDAAVLGIASAAGAAVSAAPAAGIVDAHPRAMAVKVEEPAAVSAERGVETGSRQHVQLADEEFRRGAVGRIRNGMHPGGRTDRHRVGDLDASPGCFRSRRRGAVNMKRRSVRHLEAGADQRGRGTTVRLEHERRLVDQDPAVARHVPGRHFKLVQAVVGALDDKRIGNGELEAVRKTQPGVVECQRVAAPGREVRRHPLPGVGDRAGLPRQELAVGEIQRADVAVGKRQHLPIRQAVPVLVVVSSFAAGRGEHGRRKRRGLLGGFVVDHRDASAAAAGVAAGSAGGLDRGASGQGSARDKDAAARAGAHVVALAFAVCEDAATAQRHSSRRGDAHRAAAVPLEGLPGIVAAAAAAARLLGRGEVAVDAVVEGRFAEAAADPTMAAAAAVTRITVIDVVHVDAAARPAAGMGPESNTVALVVHVDLAAAGERQVAAGDVHPRVGHPCAR